MRQKTKHFWKQTVSCALCIAMLAPNVTPIAAEAAIALENMPRRVDFSRPQALTLGDLGLATGSTAGTGGPGAAHTEENQSESASPKPGQPEEIPLATDSDIREPESFYDDSTDEPEGILVQFDEERNIRTYEQAEGEYITMIGGNSGLYRGEDGVIYSADNRMLSTVEAKNTASEEAETEENQEITLINDLGLGIFTGTDLRKEEGSFHAEKDQKVPKASDSNASASESQEGYYNAGGSMELWLPEDMGGTEGYTIGNGEDSLEIIPLEGDYSRSASKENAVRFSSVFPGVDVQYTMLNDTVKEDIILLEPQEKNQFSYQLKSDTLKFKKDGDVLFAYKDSYRSPSFALTAPVMIDADGAVSRDITLTYDKSKKILTYTADKDWLQDADRAYPVRIDPAGAVLVDYQAFQMNMVAKGGQYLGTPEAYTKYFGLNINPMAGFSEDFGYCRALITINADWESLMGSNEQEGPDLVNVELKLNTMTTDTPNNTGFAAFIPNTTWDPSTITWEKMKNQGVDSGMVQTGEIQYSSDSDNNLSREMCFDITNIYDQWLKNPASRTGLMIQAYVEGGDENYKPGESDITSVSWAETFYNQAAGSALGPCLRVEWKGQLQGVDLETLDMSEFSVALDAGVTETLAGGRNTEGVLLHGISQADSTIDYKLHTKSGRVVDEGSVTAGNAAENPDFTQVNDDCIPARYLDSNWQSDPPHMTQDPLEPDRIYYYTAKGTGKEIVENEAGELEQGTETVETEWLESDEFLLYRVQASDILPRIARHYGVDTNQLREDNMFRFQLAEAGDVIFVRNPETEEPYTPSMTPGQMEEFIKNSLMNGENPRCEVGGEPVNLSTGSFYMSQTDASLEELGGTFAITRSYNGLTPYFRS